MTVALEPMRSSHRDSFVYFGEREGWLIALQVHRDSDALERSNWEVITADMLKRFPRTAAIERMNHWAVGWVDYLLVKPKTKAAEAAEKWAEKLDNYPVADEKHFSDLEWAEEWCSRCDRGTRAQHDGRSYGTCGKFRSKEDASEIRWRWRDHRGIAANWFLNVSESVDS